MVDGHKIKKDGPKKFDFFLIEFRPEVVDGEPAVGNYSLQYLWEQVVVHLEARRVVDAEDIEFDIDRYCLTKTDSIMSCVSTQFLRLLLLLRVPLAIISDWYSSLPFSRSVGKCMTRGFVDSHFCTEPVLAALLFFFRCSKVSVFYLQDRVYQIFLFLFYS